MNCLITGAGRGIGRGLTHSLLKKGHSVYLVDNNAPELQHTLSLASEWVTSSSLPPSQQPSKDRGTSRVQGKVVDLADRTAIKDMVRDVSAFFDGKLDVLVNNAFPTPHTWAEDKGMEDDDESIVEQWDHKLAVGLTAPFLLSRLCVPLLTATANGGEGRRAGSIINVSSTRWKQAEDNHEGYSAVKAGLQGLTQSMAVSLGHRHNIRVNAISPGWVNVSEQNKAADETGAKWEDELTEEDHKWHPAGRVGNAEDIAQTVIFLAENGFVTGQDVVVDGGVGRKMVYPE
jgi:NAD(P)-dependent dehydrogenase (short-subunit alcohol dehydrogenase family)